MKNIPLTNVIPRTMSRDKKKKHVSNNFILFQVSLINDYKALYIKINAHKRFLLDYIWPFWSFFAFLSIISFSTRCIFRLLRPSWAFFMCLPNVLSSEYSLPQATQENLWPKWSSVWCLFLCSTVLNFSSQKSQL